MQVITRDYQGFAQFLYVCLFDNGHIKVGRTSKPEMRISQHAKRLACIGIELVASFVAECKTSISDSEIALIKKCKKASSKQHLNEWFVGLDYKTVCEWCTEISGGKGVGSFQAKEEFTEVVKPVWQEDAIYAMYGYKRPTDTTDFRGKTYSIDPIADAVDFVLFNQDSDADIDWDEDAFYARFDELPLNVAEIIPVLTDFNSGLILGGISYEQRKPMVKQYAMDWRISHIAAIEKVA